MTYKPNLYFKNTLTRKKEEFKPVKEGEVGIYSCGPTVYWNQHIGHMYAYIHWDVLVRTLNYFGYKTNWVMNITDVGHMTGDNIGAADTGEDRMEKGAKREGISVWDLSEKYTKQFSESLDLLNIQKPDKFSRATKHIEEQINLAKKILDGGFAYETKRGLVFDTSKFPKYREFAKLSLEKQQSREDVADDPDKKSPWDFFLWVKNSKHIMKWQSPWGEGYPGWHLECSAISMKYLGDTFDIHTGGIDHLTIHHPNEMAQSQAATGKQQARWWLHNAFLNFGEAKMSKSAGTFITLEDLKKKGVQPLAFRYFVLQTHYRKTIQFSWEALQAAATGLDNLYKQVSYFDEPAIGCAEFEKDFLTAMDNDLNTPQALAVLNDLLGSNYPTAAKMASVKLMDELLGLKLMEERARRREIPQLARAMLSDRKKARAAGDWALSDQLRRKLDKMGVEVKDTKDDQIAVLKH